MPNVRQLHPENGGETELSGEMKKLAIQVAAMVPADYTRALAVLAMARQIVEEYLA